MKIWLVAIVSGLICTSALAGDGGRFHFDVGLTYTSGAAEIDDALKNAFQDAGFSYDSFVIPVGIRFDPYYQFESGFGIGGCVGPLEFGTVSGSGVSDKYWLIVPVGLDGRYTFLLNNSDVNPYVRGGFRYPIAAGDLVDNGQVGAFAAVGVNFPNMHFGIEASLDTSKVDVSFGGESKEVKPNEFMVNLFLHF